MLNITLTATYGDGFIQSQSYPPDNQSIPEYIDKVVTLISENLTEPFRYSKLTIGITYEYAG